MRLIGLAVVLAVGLTLAPVSSEAQPGRSSTIVMVFDEDSPPSVPPVYLGGVERSTHGYLVLFKQALRRVGQEKIDVITQGLDTSLKNADVIVAIGTRATMAARLATTTIPIVMVGVADPLAPHLAKSLSKPGGNVTGVSFMGAEVVEKELELLKEAAPGALRVGVLYNPENPALAMPEVWSYIEMAARRLKVEILRMPIVRPSRGPSTVDVARTLAQDKNHPVHALLILNDGRLFAERQIILGGATRMRLPTIAQMPEYPEAGGFMSYGPKVAELFERAASFVDKILKGAKPADLPVEQPTKFELVINLKTAKALGLTIPQSVLLRADQVIE